MNPSRVSLGMVSARGVNEDAPVRFSRGVARMLSAKRLVRISKWSYGYCSFILLLRKTDFILKIPSVIFVKSQEFTMAPMLPTVLLQERPVIL